MDHDRPKLDETGVKWLEQTKSEQNKPFKTTKKRNNQNKDQNVLQPIQGLVIVLEWNVFDVSESNTVLKKTNHYMQINIKHLESIRATDDIICNWFETGRSQVGIMAFHRNFCCEKIS